MLSPHFEEFVAALNARGVRYLIVGAHAVAHHATPRATKDVDLLVAPDQENAKRALLALVDFFGGANPGYTVDDFTNPDWILQIGMPPHRIDILKQLAGLEDFEPLWDRRVTAMFGSQPAFFLSLPDLIAAKRAANRPRDRDDIRRLLSSQARKKKGGESPA